MNEHTNSSSALGADKALKLLQEGNARFVQANRKFPHVNKDRLQDILSGQQPFATVLTCSDSRVPPEHFFDLGFGDIFVIRVAGNVCGIDEIGTIEYGIEHLETPLMVVLGHTLCGAVTAVVNEGKAGGCIPSLLAKIQPAVDITKSDNPQLEGSAIVTEAVKANIWRAIDDLFQHSPATRARAKDARVRVVGAIYHLEDGSVEWLGTHPRQDELLKYTGGPNLE